MFSRSPVKRVGRDSFIRNCLIAAGNSQDQALIGPVTSLLLDASPLVRAMAVWALKQLNPHGYHKAPPTEQDQHVLLEWAA
jgi:epoxyqueuosine reductase